MADRELRKSSHEYIEPKGLSKFILKALMFGYKKILNRRLNTSVSGTEFLHGREGKPTILAPNHVGYEDALVIALNSPVPISFAIDSAQHYERMNPPGFSLKNAFSPSWYAKKLQKSILHRVKLVPVDTSNPSSIRTMIDIVDSGEMFAIFPEGALTKTGSLGKIYDGIATIVQRTGAEIIPVSLRGFETLDTTSPQFTGFPKRKKAAKTSLRFFAPEGIIEPPENVKGKEAKQHVLRQIKNMMRYARVADRDEDMTLTEAFERAVFNYGYERNMLDYYDYIDPEGKIIAQKTLTYDDISLKSKALGYRLGKHTEKAENVGFLLPNGAAGTVGLLALMDAGCVPTMLNPTHSDTQLEACAKTTQMKTIVTSRKFVEKAKLESKIEALSKDCKIIFLEDEAPKISAWAKLRAVMRTAAIRNDEDKPGTNILRPLVKLVKAPVLGLGNFLNKRARKNAPAADEPTIILFSTGSEGDPKAIVHSSQSILANVEQIKTDVTFQPSDKLFNPMPIFHSFGLTVGLFTPLLSGMRNMQYPNPLDSGTIPSVAYHQGADILLGTPTFLKTWTRRGDAEDFSRAKHVFSGGERLDPVDAEKLADHFGVQVHSCYGATETAPVASIQMRGRSKKGTVGRIVAGMDYKLEHVPGYKAEKGKEVGRLYVKGPNVMLGYMKSDNPGKIVKPENGWHDMGDIVSIDKDGYVEILGRAKRFAKIGGEMVSLDVIEDFARAASDKKGTSFEHHAFAAKDDKKGEKIVVMTTDKQLSSNDMNEAGQNALGIPKQGDIVIVPAIPKIGIKVDGQFLTRVFEGSVTEQDFKERNLDPKEWNGIGNFKIG